mgnify:CR=1 FL=1
MSNITRYRIEGTCPNRFVHTLNKFNYINNPLGNFYIYIKNNGGVPEDLSEFSRYTFSDFFNYLQQFYPCQMDIYIHCRKYGIKLRLYIDLFANSRYYSFIAKVKDNGHYLMTSNIIDYLIKNRDPSLSVYYHVKGNADYWNKL